MLLIRAIQSAEISYRAISEPSLTAAQPERQWRRKDREVYEEDFDEDLSGLAESSEEEDICECQDDGPDCKCWTSADDKEDEVKAAYQALKKTESEGGTIPIDPANGHFRLFSVRHVDHCYNPDYYATKYVDFYYPGDTDADPSGKKIDLSKSGLEGHLCIHAECGRDFVSFVPPKQASSKDFTVWSHEGKGAVLFQFLDNEHLIMKVSRDLIFKKGTQDTDGPETFVFMGIRDDSARRRLARLRQEDAKRSPPTPKSKRARYR
ncbi:hypothetical protein FZEAL_5885 [Fusarium zealandicum]|uniref:Uncharacterized protein n=1 Tax=Fusarium zealandicum TaxID=1053134 RepID=A0A8H4UIU2_9HYPO|nr:hypothetical protein FZEAL_5885 [Fusarium zealandicum]